MFSAALFIIVKRSKQDFPSHPEVKNPPANAGDTGWISGLERLSMLWGHYWAHMLQLLTPTGPRAHEPPEKPLRWEACTATKEEPLLTAARESPRAATKTKHSQKLLNFFKKFTTVQMTIN